MSNRLEALKLAVQTYSKFVNVREDEVLACAEKYAIFIADDAGATLPKNPVKPHLDSTSRKK